MRETRRKLVPAKISGQKANPSQALDLQETKRTHGRKKQKGAFTGQRLRLRSDFPVAGKRTSPATPLLRWKLEDGLGHSGALPDSGEANGEKLQSNNGGGSKLGSGVSARQLAAGLWRLKSPENEASCKFFRQMASPRFDCSHSQRRSVQPLMASGAGSCLSKHDASKCAIDLKDDLQSHLSFPLLSNGVCYKLEPAITYSNSAMERATKWDHECPKTSDEVYRFYTNLNFMEDHRDTPISALSTLQLELEHARTRIHELETECQSSKKKFDHFLKKLTEERASWRRREHEKIRAVIDSAKDEFSREKKQRQRMEIVNTKLLTELSEVKLSAKKFMQDYEKERKARELMEEVCDELAKEIGEDKAEVEALKRESMKIREEVEEERKMLQMAEVWREERVQMKLVDAKLVLEEKYSQLNKLQSDLEAFLSLKSTGSLAVVREAELLKDAASSVNIQDIKEFSYQPPTSDDLISALEDLHSGSGNEKDIEACLGFEPTMGIYSPASRTSKVHTVSPENNAKNQREEDENSGWESVSHVDEEQGSSNSLEGSDPSVNGCHEETSVSGSGTEWEENGDMDMAVTYSLTRGQSRKKPSFTRLWRSCPNNGEICKTVSVEVSNGRLSTNNKIDSPDRVSGDGCLSPPSLGNWSSPDAGNPHIARGMKGCIEWPRAIQKNSLKAKLLEARTESQKIQLRHALKQKI
ncbi:hypothetical protein AMTRI_Chr02g257530 [Amborella trichopoda]